MLRAVSSGKSRLTGEAHHQVENVGLEGRMTYSPTGKLRRQSQNHRCESDQRTGDLQAKRIGR
jgi:hypothetical protein